MVTQAVIRKPGFSTRVCAEKDKQIKRHASSIRSPLRGFRAGRRHRITSLYLYCRGDLPVLPHFFGGRLEFACHEGERDMQHYTEEQGRGRSNVFIDPLKR